MLNFPEPLIFFIAHSFSHFFTRKRAQIDVTSADLRPFSVANTGYLKPIESLHRDGPGALHIAGIRRRSEGS